MLKKTVKKYLLSTSLIFSLLVFSLFFSYLGVDNLGQSNYRNNESKDNFGVFRNGKSKPGLKKISFKISSPENIDSFLRKYLTNLHPLISENSLQKIINGKTINKILVNDTLGIIDIFAVIYVPEYYFDSSPKIVWELNIPEFKTRYYQLYQGDTVLIDAWDCSVGDPKTQTHTGHFRALKIRNWPIWKDPDSDSPPVQPGLLNPLGLFTVHFDEYSTRQFHGTNIDNVQIKSYGAVSHGCIRNKNENIEKLKEFMVKKIIKSENLSSWLNSKQSMEYELRKEDTLPFTIIYKTFDINTDEGGDYIVFFKDVYGYGEKPWVDVDDPSLITTATIGNILNEFRWEHPSAQISNEKLIPILEKLISDHQNYQKYYFKYMISAAV